MNDYLRREKISFKYLPVFWLLRIAFCLAILFTGYAQWGVMVVGAAFSIGFINSTEMESMLPMTDEEIKAMRFTKVRAVWLRYLVFGLLSLAVHYLLADWMGDKWYPTPLILFHFALQMLVVLSVFIDGITSSLLKKVGSPLVKKEVKKYFTESIPHIVFFVYGIALLHFHSLIDDGPLWIHLLILGIAAVLMGIDVFDKVKAWRVTDYEH